MNSLHPEAKPDLNFSKASQELGFLGVNDNWCQKDNFHVFCSRTTFIRTLKVTVLGIWGQNQTKCTDRDLKMYHEVEIAIYEVRSGLFKKAVTSVKSEKGLTRKTAMDQCFWEIMQQLSQF